MRPEGAASRACRSALPRADPRAPPAARPLPRWGRRRRTGVGGSAEPRSAPLRSASSRDRGSTPHTTCAIRSIARSGLVAEETEGHVKRLGVDRPQRRVTEGIALPAHQARRAPTRADPAPRTASPAGSSAAPSPLRQPTPDLLIRGLRSVHRVQQMADEIPQVEGVEHRFVEANGIRIHVAEAGPSATQAPPILLLHGWPQHWYMWREVIGGLRSGHRLLAPDLRGLGWSEAPGRGYDGETLRRRPGGAPRRARGRARLRHRARLGRLDGDPARAAPPRSGGADHRLQHPPPVAPAEPQARGRGLAQLVHVGARHPRPRSPLSRAWLDRPQHPHPRQRRQPVLRPGDGDVRRQLSGALARPMPSVSSIATTSAHSARESASVGATRASPCPRCSCSASATATSRPGSSPAMSGTPTR